MVFLLPGNKCSNWYQIQLAKKNSSAYNIFLVNSLIKPTCVLVKCFSSLEKGLRAIDLNYTAPLVFSMEFLFFCSTLVHISIPITYQKRVLVSCFSRNMHDSSNAMQLQSVDNTHVMAHSQPEYTLHFGKLSYMCHFISLPAFILLLHIRYTPRQVWISLSLIVSLT